MVRHLALAGGLLLVACSGPAPYTAGNNGGTIGGEGNIGSLGGTTGTGAGTTGVSGTTGGVEGGGNAAGIVNFNAGSGYEALDQVDGGQPTLIGFTIFTNGLTCTEALDRVAGGPSVSGFVQGPALGPGTYPLGATGTDEAQITVNTGYTDGGGLIYSASSGSITIESAGFTGATGSFTANFVYPDGGSAPGTGGLFNAVPYCPGLP